MAIEDFPHHYAVSVAAEPTGPVELESIGLEPISSDAPAQFGGPGDRWAPETLLVAAVADCFALTFRAVAGASKFAWTGLNCHCTGTLEAIDKVNRFTRFELQVTLEVPPGTNEERARQLLLKAEKHCLITSSLSGGVQLDPRVLVRPLGS